MPSMWMSIYPVLSWISYICGIVFLLVLLYKLIEPFKKNLHLPPVLLIEISWRLIGLFAAVSVLLLGVRVLARYLSDQELHAQVLSLSSQMRAFAEERSQKMPPEGQPNWDQYTRKLAQWAEESRGLYSQRFAEPSTRVRHELAKRGLIDEKLDQLSEHPANPMVIRAASERLEDLAKKLE